MNETSMQMGNRQIAQAKLQLTAAQRALLERKVLPLNSLLHGAYYNGLLDDMTTIGRWHAERRRFVFGSAAWNNPNQKRPRTWRISERDRDSLRFPGRNPKG